jgi:hypothetical protein
MRSQRLRIIANRQTKKIRMDVLTEDTPHFLKPSDLQVELALFDDDGETISTDVDDLTSLTLTIKASAERTGPALMEKTVLAAAMDDAVSVENWRLGVEEHAVFNFSAAETDIDLGGEDVVTHYLLLTGISADEPPKELALANGVVIIEESGSGSELLPPSGGAAGAGNPEGLIAASPGYTYFNTTNLTFWVKSSGTGNTGWTQLI